MIEILGRIRKSQAKWKYDWAFLGFLAVFTLYAAVAVAVEVREKLVLSDLKDCMDAGDAGCISAVLTGQDREMAKHPLARVADAVAQFHLGEVRQATLLARILEKDVSIEGDPRGRVFVLLGDVALDRRKTDLALKRYTAAVPLLERPEIAEQKIALITEASAEKKERRSEIIDEAAEMLEAILEDLDLVGGIGPGRIFEAQEQIKRIDNWDTRKAFGAALRAIQHAGTAKEFQSRASNRKSRRRFLSKAERAMAKARRVLDRAISTGQPETEDK